MAVSRVLVLEDRRLERSTARRLDVRGFAVEQRRRRRLVLPAAATQQRRARVAHGVRPEQPVSLSLTAHASSVARRCVSVALSREPINPIHLHSRRRGEPCTTTAGESSPSPCRTVESSSDSRPSLRRAASPQRRTSTRHTLDASRSSAVTPSVGQSVTPMGDRSPCSRCLTCNACELLPRQPFASLRVSP